jgi:RNA polymerase sigma-70 factor, ECF subfamily
VALRIDEIDLCPDGTPLERARLGDPRAFEELYGLYHERLRRFCLYQLRNTHDAEDVVQETFARAWKALPAFAGDEVYPWLRVIARNLCADTGRRRARVDPVAEVDMGVVDGFESDLTRQVDIALVKAAMGRLSERHRTALEWREHEELSYEEIAARAGVSLGTVESLLWRARQGLKRQYEMLAGEGALGAIPALGWVVSRWKRFHVRASQWAARWNQPLVGVGNLAAVSAVGVVAAMGGLAGGAASVPALGAVTVTMSGANPAVFGSAPPAAAMAAPTPSALPATTSTSSLSPAKGAKHWALNSPVTMNKTAARQGVAQDPVQLTGPGIALGVDPTTVVGYASAVVANHVPSLVKGVETNAP